MSKRGRNPVGCSGPYLCLYSPECVENCLEIPQPRARRLTIKRIIAA